MRDESARGLSLSEYAFLIFAAVFLFLLATFADAHFVGLRLEMNVDEKIDWIARELHTDIDRVQLRRPASINIVSREKFEEAYISADPEHRERMKERLQFIKGLGLIVLGFYLPVSKDLYIAGDTADDWTLTHELTHHVRNLMSRGETMSLDELRQLEVMPDEETVAEELGMRYVCPKRWSTRLLCSMNMLQFAR